MAQDLPDLAAAGAVLTDQDAHRQEVEFMDLLAYIYLQHGLPDKAAVLLLARDLLVPDDTRALLSLALAQLRSDKPKKALQTLERLVILGAMGAEFHLIRAQALQALEQPAEAASAMRAHLAMLAIPERPVPPTSA
jgi:regulator of sirC expression with transglutaminase-like and TPR domain